MTHEKREAERVSILGHLPGEIMLFQPMLVTDISRTGATIETRFPLQLNSVHELRLTLGDISVIVKGCVMHSEINDVEQDVVVYRSGMQFVEAAERVTAAIAEYLDSVKSDRSAT